MYRRQLTRRRGNYALKVHTGMLGESERSGAPVIKMGRLPVSKEVMPYD